MFMMNTMLSRRSVCLIKFSQRSAATRSDFDSGNQMKVLNEKKQYEKTLQLFDQYKKNNSNPPSSMIITQTLKACAQVKNLERGSAIHRLVSSRVKDDPYILTSLIHLYMQCGDVTTAHSLFDKSSKDTSMYGAMMKGYITNNQPAKAINLFKEIRNPSESNVIILFNACAQVATDELLNLLKQVSSQMPKSFYNNPYVLPSLIDALMKCGDITTARSLFDRSLKKPLPMYGAMMNGYITNNQPAKAIDLFKEIPNPSEFIVTILFNACAQVTTDESLNLLKQVSSQMPKSFHNNPYLSTSLINALMKCGDITTARSLFDRSSKKPLPMYGAMMKGYVINHQAQAAIDLLSEISNPDEVIMIIFFNACAHLGTTKALDSAKTAASKMPKSFYSNFRLLNSLMDTLIKCGDYSSAESFFSKIKKKSSTIYAIFMYGTNREDNPQRTLQLFDQMKVDGIQPDSSVYTCVIQALSQIGDYSLSHSLVQHIPHSLFNDQLRCALIDMWGKTGDVNRAKEVFDNILQLNQYAYAAMINSYGLNGMGYEAVELFNQMPSKFIDEANYVCVLNACSHSGLIHQARAIYGTVRDKTDKIYTTMIDCLSRAFMFQEAQTLIDEYEQHHPPVMSMYMALLSGARNANNHHLSQQIFDEIKTRFSQLSTSLTPASILLANVYGSSGDLDKASDIRIQLQNSGAKKTPGITTTVINGKVHKLRAHDQSHPLTPQIYIEGEKMLEQLAEYGYQCDSSWITRPLQPDETTHSVLCGHSERLAIALNFVINPHTTRIQLTENLRVCGDCHTAIKLIAHIRQCEIIVRDANRIHHFYKNGRCSCNDYF